MFRFCKEQPSGRGDACDMAENCKKSKQMWSGQRQQNRRYN